MAVQDALGQAGRAGAVDDVEVVELVQRHLERRVARPLQPFLEVAPACPPEIVGDAAAFDQLAESLLVGLDQPAILLRQEQHLGVAVIQHLLERIAAMVDSGTTQAPARRPPMKVSRYSIELAARIAILSPRPTPMPASVRAMRLMRRSKSRQVRALSSHSTACLSGQAAALRATRTESRRTRETRRASAAAPGRCRGSSPTYLGSTFSTGPPAFFQAPKPPAMWATGVSPMSCAVLVASAERQAPAQKKMNLLPVWK